MTRKARKKRKPPSEAVKAAADAAERRSKGLPIDKPRKPVDPPSPLDPPETARPAAIVLPKIGRPTKYREEFCERVIALGAEGKSKAQSAAALGVTYDTWNDWEKRHPAFFQAAKCARGLALAWWENRGQRGVGEGKEFNSVAFIFQMKNRFRDDYSDRSEQVHKLDATEAFLQCVQAISKGAEPKLIEARPA